LNRKASPVWLLPCDAAVMMPTARLVTVGTPAAAAVPVPQIVTGSAEARAT
jgi:hypothetical protein